MAWGVITDAVYVNGSSQQLTTAWSVGGGFEYFWTRNFSSSIYGSYTEVSYNSTVVNNRWFCGAGGLGVDQSIVLTAATVCDPGFTYWTVGTHHDWFPLPGLRLAVDIMYNGIETATDGAVISLSKATGRSSDRSLPRQEPGHHLGHLPCATLLGRRRLRRNEITRAQNLCRGKASAAGMPPVADNNPGANAGVICWFAFR